MKKNLFRKFLALFLTGTLLAGVGCKDYDDDIDDLKGQINDLKGQVELKADASALQVVTDKLNGIDSRLSLPTAASRQNSTKGWQTMPRSRI